MSKRFEGSQVRLRTGHSAGRVSFCFVFMLSMLVWKSRPKIKTNDLGEPTTTKNNLIVTSGA